MSLRLLILVQMIQQMDESHELKLNARVMVDATSESADESNRRRCARDKIKCGEEDESR